MQSGSVSLLSVVCSLCTLNKRKASAFANFKFEQLTIIITIVKIIVPTSIFVSVAAFVNLINI